jgi:hypothetical protein
MTGQDDVKAGARLLLLLAAGFLYGLSQSVSSAAPNPSSVSSNNPTAVPMIVTLRREADQDDLVKEHGVHPHRAYHHAFNGFAAALDSGQVERLKHEPRVIAVGRCDSASKHCPFRLECTL